MKLKDLAPNPKNPRKISDDQLRRLDKSLTEFGDLSGFVYNKRTGNLVSGHQRQKVLPPEANVVLLEGGYGYVELNGNRFSYREVDWDETKEKAAVVAANQHGGEFDLPGLTEWIKELDESGIDMDLLGFSEDELKDLLVDTTVCDPQCGEDEIPEKVEPRTKRGDIYKLGNHRLMCGDSTMIDEVEKLMAGNECVLMVTDPPYGVKLDQSWRDEALGDKALGKGNAALVENDDRADWYDVWAIAPANIAYIWHASSFTDVVMDSMRRAGFDVRQQIIWNKSVMVMGRSAYHFKHEPCWYCVKKGCDANWQGDRKQTTVWDAAPPNHIMGGSKEDKTGHPTQKPVLVYDIPIMNHTRPGDGLYEPFGGSGTAIIACEKANRKCFTMELSPDFCDIIVARWEKYTGKKAELLS
jgi:DNA modification methylase